MKCLSTQVNNTFVPKKSVNTSALPLKTSLSGREKAKFNVLEQLETTDDIPSRKSHVLPVKLPLKNPNKNTATVESPRTPKKKIWKGKLSSSHLNSLITKLSGILDQESTSSDGVLTPFWTQQSTEMSKKLWLPTEIDCVDSVLNSSKKSSPPAPMGKSWFSITSKHPQKKNSLTTSFQSSQYSLPDSMDFEATPSEKKSEKKPLRTLKIRLFPTQEEKKQLQTMFDQFRWYYNAILTIVYLHYGYKKISNARKYFFETIRDLLRKYEYTEELVKGDGVNFIIQDFVYDKNRSKNPQPSWWDKDPHSRIPRGAVAKFVSSLNSAISNYKAGHNKGFDMKFRSKKNPTEYLHFEDKGYPSMIREIKSHYWYRNTKGRTKISFKDLNSTKGLEIIYEKETGKYFLHCPISRDWFPEDDKRSDKQATFNLS